MRVSKERKKEKKLPPVRNNAVLRIALKKKEKKREKLASVHKTTVLRTTLITYVLYKLQ
jgi:hypothetical protein